MIYNSGCRRALSMVQTDEAISEVKVEKEIQEISVENPYSIEEDAKEEKSENVAVGSDGTKLVYNTPRLFRKSLIFKTWKLFGAKKECEPKLYRPLKENLWWLAVMLVGFLMAFLITDKAWTKFNTNPTFTSLVLDHEDSRIVFPSLSICPTSAANPAKVDHFVGISGLKGSDAQQLQEFLTELPNFSYGKKGLKSLILSNTLTNKLEDLSIKDMRVAAFKLAHSCADVFGSCSFKGKPVDCCEAFLPVFSEHGFCYSFNARDYGAPLIEIFNDKIESIEEFDDHKLAMEIKVPSRTFLNSQEESLHFEQKPIGKVEVNKSNFVVISMQETKSEAGLKDLWIKQRKCFFRDEKKLKYFKDHKYTYSSCMKECKMEKAMQYCGCLPPFYRPNGAKNLKYCDADSLKCLKDEKIWNITSCTKCHLGCDFTVFSVVNNLLTKIPEVQMRQPNLILSFEHWPQVSYHREIRFGFIDFLVAFGSILALFLGFSLLSAIEVLLYVVRFIATKFCPKET